MEETAPTYIWFGANAGNIIPSDPEGHSYSTFNYNTLYRVEDKNGATWYFRFSGEWFDQKTHRTALYGVRWSDEKYPLLPGEYHVASVSAPRPQSGEKTFSTIGDSMIWFNDGQYFRCKLAEKLPDYRFIGSNTDSFGFGHDGHGGDNSDEILRRLGRVPTSDAYFLLMGSNDGDLHPKGTADNIARIVSRLMKRGNHPHIYVGTLPVRGDNLADLVPKRNAAIERWYALCGCHSSVTLIHTRAAMLRAKDALAKYINPKPDLIHPNIAGYNLLAKLISDAVMLGTASS